MGSRALKLFGSRGIMTELLSILNQEVKPALGCTGPTSVAFAVSVARAAIGGAPRSVNVIVDRDTYKNSVSVGMPGTSKRGLVIASALGALYGDSTAGLEVLHNVKVENESKAELFAQNSVQVEIKWDYEGIGLYIEAFVETEKGIGRAIVAKTHANVILEEANGKILKEAPELPKQGLFDHANDPIRKYRVRDFHAFSRNVAIEQLAFLKDAIAMNLSLAEKGLHENLGIGYGPALGRIPGDPAIVRAKALAASAADLRMAGVNCPAMSCASSGNVGIAASLPLVAVAEANSSSEEELLRAVCLSFLLTIYVKSHIGRLSAMCACAIAASLGVTAGTTMMLGGDLTHIEAAIGNVAGSIGGVICDGAKSGCALKLATAAGVAIEAAYLSRMGVAIPGNDGIVSSTADETIALLGVIASCGMVETDRTLCQAIIGREKPSS
jgi:L-cysteine desulfidase